MNNEGRITGKYHNGAFFLSLDNNSFVLLLSGDFFFNGHCCCMSVTQFYKGCAVDKWPFYDVLLITVINYLIHSTQAIWFADFQ